MLSDIQISRLLDVANAACHGGNVVDARAMYAGCSRSARDLRPLSWARP